MKRLLGYTFLFLALCSCMGGGRYAAMRSGLDSINQLNRTDQPFTPAGVQPYMDYFDQHGTANDRMLAHYLMGRAFYEQGEAPMALQYYHEAIDCADTTAQDCDYPQLARVYGQMALVFYDQGLYRQHLRYDNRSVEYAWRGRDTLLALRNYGQECFSYTNLNMPDSALFVIEDVVSKYERYGYHRNAAIALGCTIMSLLDNGEYSKAKRYMDIYESGSGFFDAQGNIAKGREVYYGFKGLYYIKTGKLDSAEYYFRKELRDGEDFNNQLSGALGLAKVYRQYHHHDSATKYALYAYDMNDSLYARRATQTVERLQAMYDYSRNQEIAQKEKENTAKEKRKLYVSVSLLLAIMAVSAYLFLRMSEERQKQRALYLQNLEQLEQTQSEILQLRLHADEYEELLAEKEKLLVRQSEELQMHSQKQLLSRAVIEKNLQESDIYHVLQSKRYGQGLSVDELRACRKLIIENLPELNNLLLLKQYQLNSKDFNVCILFRLGFKSKEIGNMLKISPGRVSQICAKILHNVFGKDDGGAAELIEILHEIR